MTCPQSHVTSGMGRRWKTGNRKRKRERHLEHQQKVGTETRIQKQAKPKHKRHTRKDRSENRSGKERIDEGSRRTVPGQGKKGESRKRNYAKCGEQREGQPQGNRESPPAKGLMRGWQEGGGARSHPKKKSGKTKQGKKGAQGEVTDRTEEPDQEGEEGNRGRLTKRGPAISTRARARGRAEKKQQHQAHGGTKKVEGEPHH